MAKHKLAKMWRRDGDCVLLKNVKQRLSQEQRQHKERERETKRRARGEVKDIEAAITKLEVRHKQKERKRWGERELKREARRD